MLGAFAVGRDLCETGKMNVGHSVHMLVGSMVRRRMLVNMGGQRLALRGAWAMSVETCHRRPM